MSESSVPHAVREFLHEHIESYEHLEILLLFLRDPRSLWTPDAAARELHIEVDAAHSALRHLAKRKLLEVGAQGVAGFRYQPDTPKLEAAAEALLEVYEGNRLGIMMLMSSNAMARIRMAALRTFSEAFRLRGPKGNR